MDRQSGHGLTIAGWLLVAIGGAAIARSGSLHHEKFPKPTAEQRLDMIRRARVFEPSDVATKDLYAGPPGRLPFGPGDEIDCTFYPKQMTGRSEKFSCRLDDGTIVKVKYNGIGPYKEVFGEVLGTRLFWALGFYADRMIPVEVTCHGCPERPWDYVSRSTLLPHDDKGLIAKLPEEAHAGTHRFPLAAIEDPVDAATIEEKDQQGWDWKALDLVDPSRGGASRAEIDALKLLNAFVQNADNKAKQNTLACPQDAIDGDRNGTATCERPILYVDDLGSVFGAGGFTTGGPGRIDYVGWRSRKVWRDDAHCRARLTSVGGVFRRTTLKDPVIGEAGRALLAAQLDALSDKQIADLFRVARVEALHETFLDETRRVREVTIDDWVALFKKKRREITEHARCPDR